MTEQDWIQVLRNDGHDPVEAYTAEPNEEDTEHTHDFDTALVVLDGEIYIKMGKLEKIFKQNEKIVIPKGEVHYSKVGPMGCRYIHAERH